MGVTKIRGINVADWTVVFTDENYTAVKDDHVCIDSSAMIIISLLPNPDVSDRVKITDVEGACVLFPCTVYRNGSLMMKQAANDSIALNYVTVIYTYLNPTYGWIKEFLEIQTA